MQPLFSRYRTRAGNCYVYDISTGEILRIDETVYQILEDFGVLTADELCAKHAALGAVRIHAALAQLASARQHGFLRDHYPELSAKVEAVCCGKQIEPLRDFIQHRRRMLTLELTHQCNLACEYCSFGAHYNQTRQQSREPMLLDTAKLAVARAMSHKPTMLAIAFYGGEPLLEFQLMKDIVAFAEELGAAENVETRFAITTNGTLLSDEKIHYMVMHKFSVMISLDGTKEAHDRYRVFKSPSGRARCHGSFDVITRQMERFVELYPDYMSRGIVLTLTATCDVAGTEQFVRMWKTSFPVLRANIVAPVPGHLQKSLGEYPIGIGDGGRRECSETSCLRGISDKQLLCETPDFDDWSEGRLGAFRVEIDKFVKRLCHSHDKKSAQRLWDEFPICEQLFRRDVEGIHQRQVVGKAARKPPAVRLSCFPGATRTYCSSRGVLFPCERTEFGNFFEIGSSAKDVDAEKACSSLIEMVRLSCDCGNCIIHQICGLCPSQLSEAVEAPGTLDRVALQRACGLSPRFSIGSTEGKMKCGLTGSAT